MFLTGKKKCVSDRKKKKCVSDGKKEEGCF